MTPTLLTSYLSAATGSLVSVSTVCKRLHEGDLYAERPAIFVALKSVHRRDRLQLARQHVHWTSDQWRAVLLTNEGIGYGESLEHVIIRQTSVKEMHTEEEVSAFGVAFFWLDAKTSISFQEEP